MVMNAVLQPEIIYSRQGWCPICEKSVEFTARQPWYRDHLLCSGCGSIPRERALALVLSRHFPDWRSLTIHESSPGGRGLSVKLSAECRGYMPSQYFPGKSPGAVFSGFRNENLEHQTLETGSLDLVITQDVMEHVNDPAKVFAEISRTLKPSGAYLFTTPTYKDLVSTQRRATYHADGTIEYLAEPEYHGNPIDNQGSLVTYHFGHDLVQLAAEWSSMDVEVIRFCSPSFGIIGEFTEVYVVSK